MKEMCRTERERDSDQLMMKAVIMLSQMPGKLKKAKAELCFNGYLL
jgi:hypothetical protein